MKDYIAYYRVSTVRQGESGLGLEAQESAVARFTSDGRVIASYRDIESGKRDHNRIGLHKALAECKKTGATLVIAKLDRLSRNMAFIANLMESGVEFIACDMPSATKFTIHILAAVAEHEREMISARTRAALQAKKARGVKLGSPNWRESLAKASAAHAKQKQEPEIVAMIMKLRNAGLSYAVIARQLNDQHVVTIYGKPWYGSTVRNQVLVATGGTPAYVRRRKAVAA